MTFPTQFFNELYFISIITVSFVESEKLSLCISYFQTLYGPLVTVCYKEEQLTSVYFHYLEKAEEMCVCVNHVTVSESETSLP